MGKDPFLVDWNRWKLIYLFPPTPMILWVLNKMSTFKGRAFIITPFSPNQPWFPLLMSKSVEHHLFPKLQLHQSQHKNFLVQLKSPFPPRHVDFLREAYSSKFSQESAAILIQSNHDSSRHWYQTSWKSFTTFIRLLNPDMSEEIVLSFMRHLFTETPLLW